MATRKPTLTRSGARPERSRRGPAFSRTRERATPIVILCVAAVLLAALIPSAPIVVCAVLLVLSLVVRDAIGIARFAVIENDDQPLSLLALALFRAPPASAPLI